VSQQEDKYRVAELEQVNADLLNSLDRCRAILKDCRSKLAANNNKRDFDEQSSQRSG
jgi:hypothetical protein